MTKAQQVECAQVFAKRVDQGQFVEELTAAEALREAALALEHGAEFNANETYGPGWNDAMRAENIRLIKQSRELHARADALEV